MSGYQFSDEEQVFFGIAALGAVAAVGMIGFAAYRASRPQPDQRPAPALGAWSPEGEYVFPVELRDPRPTREIRLTSPVVEIPFYELPEEVFAGRVDSVLDSLEREVLANSNTARSGHMFSLEDRKGLERVLDEGTSAQQRRADRLLRLHDIANGDRRWQSEAPAMLSAIASDDPAAVGGRFNALGPSRNRQGLTFQEWAERAGWSEAAKNLTGQGYETPEIAWQMGEDPEEVRAENVGAAVSLAHTIGVNYPHSGGINALKFKDRVKSWVTGKVDDAHWNAIVQEGMRAGARGDNFDNPYMKSKRDRDYAQAWSDGYAIGSAKQLRNREASLDHLHKVALNRDNYEGERFWAAITRAFNPTFAQELSELVWS